MKLTKTKIKAILLAKELMEKQDKFILDNNLNNIPINEDFTNFISSNYKNLPTDKNGLIDWESLEKSGDV